MDVVVVERGGGFSVRLTAVAIYCVPQAGHTIANSVCSQSWYQTGLLIRKLCQRSLNAKRFVIEMTHAVGKLVGQKAVSKLGIQVIRPQRFL